ncbi:hypothetical protein ABPG77_010632 [Micractinium sp. CCAP 211/92]
MAGVSTGLRSYLWQKKPYEEKARREVWVLNGATYEGYRSYIRRVKDHGFPAPPEPAPDGMELARLPTTQSSVEEELSTPQHTDQQQRAPQPGTPERSSSAAAAQPGQLEQGAQAGGDLPAYLLRTAFDVARCPVSIVKFARGSADLLAWGDDGGVVCVATAEEPPRLLQVLERHRDRVADLDWSPDGAELLSCSRDGTACLWRPDAGQLIRTFRNATGPLTCCRFHPANPNLLLLGTAAGEVLALNASTGHLVGKADLQAAPMAGVGCSCLEPAGSGMLLVADSRGCLHLLSAALHAGVLQRLSLLARFPPPGGRYHEPSCLEFVPYSPLARGPAVLLALSSGEIALSRLHEQPWRLELKREVRTAQASAKIRASLRPGVALEQPELLLCGSEDCRVHIVDVSSKGAPLRLLAALEAHKAPVLGVAWSEDESRLASCDKKGVVAVWDAQQRAAAAGPAGPAHSSSGEAVPASAGAAAAATAGEPAAT